MVCCQMNLGSPKQKFLDIDLSNDGHNDFWESSLPSRSYSEERFQSLSESFFEWKANEAPAFLPSQQPQALKSNAAEASVAGHK